MAFGDTSHRARTDPNAPRAFGVCDFCGGWWNLGRLAWQVEYYGPSLQRTGFRVCPECFDRPQPQLKPVILPPDPVPVEQPRTDPQVTPVPGG